MENVVLVTGASTGIGNETAKLFQTKNWKVAATMRRPHEADDLRNIVDVECIALDVTDPPSISAAIDETLQKFGRIDAVVNNAGYAVVGPFEASSDEQVRMQFDTNVFGVMNVCRAILPHFRERRRGVIVNVASIGGRITFPLYSVYHATKWAVEGFSEALQYEVKQFGIRVKIIEPGPIRTDFYTRSQSISRKEGLDAYDNFVARALPNLQKAGETAPGGRIVAEAIYDAVTDPSTRMRYGVNTKGLLWARRLLPESVFYSMIRRAMLR
jgi:NAD(P)-dependent dehydrogenase (short-subunit alcohol dehydrogenase family)